MPTIGESGTWGAFRPRGLAAVGIGLTRRRIVRGALRRLVGNAVSSLQPCFDVMIDDLKMRCVGHDNPTEWGLIVTGARQDRAGRAVILEGLAPGDVFVDIGANCGAFTLFAARRVGATGRVIAIEPMAEMVSRLSFNVRANDFTNVQIFETAVGPAEGRATLYVNEGQRGLSSMSGRAGGTQTTVPVATLHAIVMRAGVDRIDAMKIDIEGYEDRALLPYFTSTGRRLWPRRILMEITWSARWETDCLERLQSVGYVSDWRGHGDVLLRLQETG
jgi:FkbM family methyltransferase